MLVCCAVIFNISWFKLCEVSVCHYNKDFNYRQLKQ